MKAVKQTVRHYYKYIYSSYTLPTMISSTTPEGSVDTNISATTYSKAGYEIFFNNSDYYYDAYVQSGSRYATYTFKNLLKEGTYTFSFNGLRQSNVTSVVWNWVIGYEDGTSETILSGATFDTSVITYSNTFTASKKIRSITLNSTASSSTSSYICIYFSNVNLTCSEGLYIVSGSTESTSADYDFYEDVEEYKIPLISGVYKAYKF